MKSFRLFLTMIAAIGPFGGAAPCVLAQTLKGANSSSVSRNAQTAGGITGITAGTGLTGGGVTGNVSLAVNEKIVAFQSDLMKAVTALNTSIAGAQSAAVNSTESYVNANFLSLAGGSLTGSLTIRPPFLNANVADVFDVIGASGEANFQRAGQNVRITAGNGSDDSGINMDVNGGSGGSIFITAGSGGASGNAGLGGNGGNISLLLGEPGFSAASGFGPPPARGQLIIQGDDNGQLRGSPAQIQLQGSSNSSKQLLIGYLSDGGPDLGYGAIQATVDNVQNRPLLLNPNGGGVGIQTSSVTNSLTIGYGQGPAVADGWYVYSSRRFKNNIQTLSDALAKVEKLRGVSYDLKANGKHEIGVIAEEVGAVVPEVVQWEQNGKDARGVDYGRLTALLIEATKAQQAEISRLTATLNSAMKQINAQKVAIRDQARSIRLLSTRSESASAVLEVATR